MTDAQALPESEPEPDVPASNSTASARPTEPFRAPIGTRDIAAPDSTRRRAFVNAFAATVERAGYTELSTPIFEDLGVFLRVGESTDVVTKEMYDFVDKGGRRMALRPELTAGVCRSFVENRPQALPHKVWYSGPQFRYEAPQKGRFRQFDQVGIEVLGAFDPDLDVEVIGLASSFFSGLGLSGVTLLVNTLGELEERKRYTDVLRDYFQANRADLSEESVITLERNPLRVLDSKRRHDQSVVASAPLITEVLSARSLAYFDAVLEGLNEAGINHEVSPRLVRGLDYYCHTTFEFAASGLDAAQNAVGGGGRYDGLVDSLGGPPTPGVGFALGVDRSLMACDAEGAFAALMPTVDVFVVDTTDGTVARSVVRELRDHGISADRSWAQDFTEQGGQPRSMKAQMKAANRCSAAVAVIVGTDERAAGTVTIRDLRRSEQHIVPADELLPTVFALVRGSDG